MAHLDLGQPGKSHDFRRHLRNALVDSGDQDIRMRAGFAYATRAGVEELLDSLHNVANWDSASKLWLIGVHHGITEPVAINMLVALPNSTVRLATCGLPLGRAIKGAIVFHAKVISVEEGLTHEMTTLIAGSANLTAAAIGRRTRNFEAGITWDSPIEARIAQRFDSWWQDVWKSGARATPEKISNYVEQRANFLYRNPDILLDVSPHGVDAVAEAWLLWIEAGAMSTGGSRNAVDFNAELATFFGPLSDETRLISIVAEGGRWDDRSLSPKTTTFNVPLWRLSLPTKAKGGYDYANRIICLTKIPKGGDVEFELKVADEGSQVAAQWRIETERYGSIGRTGGGHIYGFR